MLGIIDAGNHRCCRSRAERLEKPANSMDGWTLHDERGPQGGIPWGMAAGRGRLLGGVLAPELLWQMPQP
jgi:hypothetical protein